MSFWDLVHRLRAPVLEDAEAGSGCLREARAFARVLEAIPIGIRPGDVLAGEFGPEWAARPFASAPNAKAPVSSEPPDVRALMRERFHVFGGYTTAHTTLDYGRIVHEGLDAFMARSRDWQRSRSGNSREYLDAMGIALEAVCAWAGRYAPRVLERGEVLEM